MSKEILNIGYILVTLAILLVIIDIYDRTRGVVYYSSKNCDNSQLENLSVKNNKALIQVTNYFSNYLIKGYPNLKFFHVEIDVILSSKYVEVTYMYYINGDNKMYTLSESVCACADHRYKYDKEILRNISSMYRMTKDKTALAKLLSIQIENSIKKRIQSQNFKYEDFIYELN